MKNIDCIETEWNKFNGGYGHKWNPIEKRIMLAHIEAYRNAFGDIPAGMCVLHKCDNRSCINPEHLFAGTNLDNIRDRVNKGRSVSGEDRSYLNAQMSPWKACGIMGRMLQGATNSEASREFDVTRGIISSIREGKSWKWLFEGGVEE